MKTHPIAHALIRVAKSWYPGYRQAKQEHYRTNIGVFDDQCVSIWFPAKSEDGCRPISAETHCQDDSNDPRQAKSLHGCNENLSLDTEEHEKKKIT